MNLVCVSGMADASASGGAGQVPTQRGERERSPTRTPTTQEQQQPTQGPQRFRMNSPEGGQGLPGGATAPYASVPPPPPKAASAWLWKYARKSNWTARSFLHCADDSDSPDSVFEFEPGYG